MTPDLQAALARVPSPVEHWLINGGRCTACATLWGTTEWHEPDCWWPSFQQARDALGQAFQDALAGWKEATRQLEFRSEELEELHRRYARLQAERWCWEPGHVRHDLGHEGEREPRLHCVICTDRAMETARAKALAAGVTVEGAADPYDVLWRHLEKFTPEERAEMLRRTPRDPGPGVEG
jgi:hypothetical protein